jgi:ribosomal protein L16 Arg81 hydroxylase
VNGSGWDTPANEAVSVVGCDFDTYSHLTAQQFFSDYVLLQKPVLIRNAMTKGTLLITCIFFNAIQGNAVYV